MVMVKDCIRVLIQSRCPVDSSQSGTAGVTYHPNVHYNKYITNKVPKMNKTQILMNRIVQVDNFQNMACVCANFEEFVEELAEWGVDGCAKIDFDEDMNRFSPIDIVSVSDIV